jgi:hypothetical protein
LRGRLGHLAGVALDLRFQLDRRLIEIVVLIGLIGCQTRGDSER